MLKSIVFFLFLGCSSYLNSQYCMSGGPSSTADSNLEKLQFTGTSGGINFIGCPGVTGIQEYFSETTTVNAGASYVLTVEFGTCGGNYSSVAEIWIDFNGDNIFEPNESILTWSGTPPMALGNYVIAIPSTALSGQTRMRVIHAENQSLPLNPCLSFTWGSVTDFLITIENGIDCSSYIGDDRNDARLVPTIPYTETYDNSFCYSNQNPTYNSPDVFYKFSTSMNSSVKVS
ncbi:GEVED domain-containing protein, partial [Crocinitomicaceae bacterium]|nr:GEVED domain-containing protein [Crocinitomicaceae bacterium]